MSWVKKNQGDVLVLSPNTDPVDLDAIDDHNLSSSIEEEEIRPKSVESETDIIENISEVEIGNDVVKNEEEVTEEKKREGDTTSGDSWGKTIETFRNRIDYIIRNCNERRKLDQLRELLDLMKEKTVEVEKINARFRRRIQKSKSSPSSPSKPKKRKSYGGSSKKTSKSNNNNNSIYRSKTPPNSSSRVSRYRKNISSTPSPKRSKKRKFLESSSSKSPSSLRRHSSPYISPSESPSKKHSQIPSGSPKINKSGGSRSRKHLSPSNKKDVRLSGRVLSFELFPAKKSNNFTSENIKTSNSTESLTITTNPTTATATALHEKLSSPDRKIILDPEDLKRKIHEKQEQALRRRHRMSEKKRDQFRKSKEKIIKVKQRKEKMVTEKHQRTEQRHKKARDKRQEFIGRRMETAREVHQKVKEVKFCVSVTERWEKDEKMQSIHEKHQKGMARKKEDLQKKVEAAKKLNEKEGRVKRNRERLQLLKQERRKSREERSAAVEKRMKRAKLKEMSRRKKKLIEHNEKVKKTKIQKQRERVEAKERMMKKIHDVSERKKVSIQTIKKRAERALEKVRIAKITSSSSPYHHPHSYITKNNKKQQELQQNMYTHQNRKKKKKNKKNNIRSSSTYNNNYKVPSRIFEERLKKSKEELFKFKKKYLSSPHSQLVVPLTPPTNNNNVEQKKLREIVQHMNSLMSTKRAIPNSTVSNVTRSLRKLINYDSKYLIEGKKTLNNFIRFYNHLETQRAKTTMVQFFLYLVNECKVSNFLMRSLMITKFFEMTVHAMDVGDIGDAVLLICILITCLSDEFHALKTDNDVQIRFARIVTQVLSSYGLIHQVVQLIHDYAVSGGWPGGRGGVWAGLDMSTHIPDYIHNAFFFVREVCREQFFHVLDVPVSFSGSSSSDGVHQQLDSTDGNRKTPRNDNNNNDKPFVIKVFQTIVCPELTQFLATLILAPVRKGGPVGTDSKQSSSSEEEEEDSSDHQQQQQNQSSSSSPTIIKTVISDSLIDLTSIILESLNHLARYDLKFVQKFLWQSFEFRHLVHTLLSYATSFIEERPQAALGFTPLRNNVYGILNQVILLLGYFSCKNRENQNLLHLRTSKVTILKQLCNLPLQYYSDDECYIHVVLPTLICCIFENETNTSILREEVDTMIIFEYIEKYQTIISSSLLLLDDRSGGGSDPTTTFLRKNPEFKLSNRFPMGEMEKVKLYLMKE